MRFSFWPRSLFGRLIAALVIAVVLAQAASLYLFARDWEHFVVDSRVQEWSRRITEMTRLLEQIPREERTATIIRLKEQAFAFTRWHPPRRKVPMQPGPPMSVPFVVQSYGIGTVLPGSAAAPPPPAAAAVMLDPLLGYGPIPSSQPQVMLSAPPAPASAPSWPHALIPLPFTSRVHSALERKLRTDLGNAYAVSVGPAAAPAAQVIPIPSPFFAPPSQQTSESYDIHLRLPDNTALIYRVTGGIVATALPRNLLINLTLMFVLVVLALYVTTRSITRPLWHLAQAADNLGRNVGQPKLPERGALELRRAARAFNTMQDRLHRYLDSRTRVLAAMSHDLKTPLTILRLRVEAQVEDPALRKHLRKQLDEMENMVRGALSLFRGFNDQETPGDIDLDSLLETVRRDFEEMANEVTIAGCALAPFAGKPHALKRCITNLVANAVKFGTHAHILVQDGAQLQIIVRDDGPGIPPDELESVFEPFYRLESSRNRDTGGTGLGLSIARDVAQEHGGSLVLRNRPAGGLEARLTLPRDR